MYPLRWFYLVSTDICGSSLPVNNALPVNTLLMQKAFFYTTNARRSLSNHLYSQAWGGVVFLFDISNSILEQPYGASART